MFFNPNKQAKLENKIENWHSFSSYKKRDVKSQACDVLLRVILPDSLCASSPLLDRPIPYCSCPFARGPPGEVEMLLCLKDLWPHCGPAVHD